MPRHYACHCCGFLTLSDPSFGSFEICPVCFWEDDPVQNIDRFYVGGANAVSLDEAQKNYVLHGAIQEQYAMHVRPVKLDEIPRPPPLMGLAEDLVSAHQKAIRFALLGITRSVRTGDIGIGEGCLAISFFHGIVDRAKLGEALRIFVGVASELGEHPFGGARDLWAPASLAQEDAQFRSYEGSIREEILAACARLEELLRTDLTEKA